MVEDFDVGKLRNKAQGNLALCEGVTFAGKLSGMRNQECNVMTLAKTGLYTQENS